MNKILDFFDKLEDKIRTRLSRHPIPYALLGGTAVVLFWRGVWLLADEIPAFTGPKGVLLSLAISVLIMLSTGLFVSFFISNRVLLSGILKERKLAEKTHGDFLKTERTEMHILIDLEKRLIELERELAEIKKHIV